MLFYLYDMYSALWVSILRRMSKALVYKTNINQMILQILWINGYINGFILLNNNKIAVFLKYINKVNTIRFLQPISKSGRRVYISKKQCGKLHKYNSLLGVISNNKGIMTHTMSFFLVLGGELLFLIY